MSTDEEAVSDRLRYDQIKFILVMYYGVLSSAFRGATSSSAPTRMPFVYGVRSGSVCLDNAESIG